MLLYIHRLPDTSLTHALVQGGREFFGWGQDRHLLADLFDISTPPKSQPWPRPTKQEKKTTVRDLWNKLTALSRR